MSVRAAVLALAIVFAFAAPVTLSAQPSPAKNILVLHFGSESFPANPLIDSGIHEAFAEHREVPVTYYAEYLESDLITSPDLSEAFKEYIQRKFRGIRIDLVVANTDPLLRFAQTYRAELFPDAPTVYWGLQVPDVAARSAGAGITGVKIGVNYRETLQMALSLQPWIRRVFVIANNPDRKAQEAARAIVGEVPGVTLTYLAADTVKDLLAAVRNVPRDSVIIYLWHGQFHPGEVIYADEVGRRVARASPVPVYGPSDLYMGSGFVGGVIRSSRETGKHVGQIAVRVLTGTRPQDIPFETAQMLPTVDWREIRRWNIDGSLLPEGTQILFREPTLWERYRRYLLAAAVIVCAQAVLISALFVQLARRKRAEGELRQSYRRVRDLGSRLLSAQDDERARIARDLHDDISQRLAVLKMDMTVLSRSVNGDAESLAAQALQRTDAIASGVRDLSHRLHPSRLRLMGLAPAIAGLRTDMSRPGLDITFTHENVPSSIPREHTVSLFRVAQEAVQNALKYSQARTIAIALEGTGADVVLTVNDDGVGFDVRGVDSSGLGITSMRERVDALGGTLEIRSARGAGTTVIVRIPVQIAEPRVAV